MADEYGMNVNHSQSRTATASNTDDPKSATTQTALESICLQSFATPVSVGSYTDEASFADEESNWSTESTHASHEGGVDSAAEAQPQEHQQAGPWAVAAPNTAAQQNNVEGRHPDPPLREGCCAWLLMWLWYVLQLLLCCGCCRATEQVHNAP